jgi:uncharacterized protein YcaQ
VSDSGAWHYAFIYDLVPRHFPDLVDRAHEIAEHEARQTLLGLYLDSVGAASLREIQRVFGVSPANWETPRTERDLRKMQDRGEVRLGVEVEGVAGTCAIKTNAFPSLRV